jgi:heme iron utilization protein
MPHEPRLTQALRALLASRRTAALGTLDAANPGQPFVSMVPYAIEPDSGCFIVHLSGLAPHTRNLQQNPQASLMVCAAEIKGEPVHALSRVTLDVMADTLPDEHPDQPAARAAYLARFPEAEPMTGLGDFRFVRLRAHGARQVAGFGAARSVEADELTAVLRGAGLPE